MAYNHGREDRKWRIWKEAEEKLLRECGVDEATIEQIRMADRADFNSNRRFYRWTNEHGHPENPRSAALRRRHRPEAWGVLRRHPRRARQTRAVTHRNTAKGKARICAGN